MAINQYGKQVVKETDNGTFDDGDLSQADANEGLIVTFKANDNWQDGQAKYVKPTAIGDTFAGVVLNVSKANLTSTSVPSLDPLSTAPGGNVVRVGTRGNYLLKKESAVQASDRGDAVVPSTVTAGQVVTKGTPAATDTVVGYVIGAADNPNNLLLVRLA